MKALEIWGVHVCSWEQRIAFAPNAKGQVAHSKSLHCRQLSDDSVLHLIKALCQLSSIRVSGRNIYTGISLYAIL